MSETENPDPVPEEDPTEPPAEPTPEQRAAMEVMGAPITTPDRMDRFVSGPGDMELVGTDAEHTDVTDVTPPATP